MKTLKEVYERLKDNSDLYLESVELCVEAYGIICLLSTIDNGKEYIYFTKHGDIDKEQQACSGNGQANIGFKQSCDERCQ